MIVTQIHRVVMVVEVSFTYSSVFADPSGAFPPFKSRLFELFFIVSPMKVPLISAIDVFASFFLLFLCFCSKQGWFFSPFPSFVMILHNGVLEVAKQEETWERLRKCF